MDDHKNEDVNVVPMEPEFDVIETDVGSTPAAQSEVKPPAESAGRQKGACAPVIDDLFGSPKPQASAGAEAAAAAPAKPGAANWGLPPEKAERLRKVAADRARGTRLPNDWQLPDTWRDWVLSEFPSWKPEDVRRVADCFRDYWVAKAGADARKLDWEATWRNWVRREEENRQRREYARKRGSSGPDNTAAFADARKLIFDENGKERGLVFF